jgi:cytochrome b
MTRPAQNESSAVATRVRVWDLPTRLFHWALAVLVTFSVVSAKVGGNAMNWHFWSGYAVLTLVIFRVLWGVAGDRHSRFAAFVGGPRALFAYLRGRSDGGAGHTPVGALSTVAMLAAVLVQAATGLFANDAIFTEGPLARLVSGSTSDRLTTVHHWNEKLIYALVALHVAAVAFFETARNKRLVLAMISGDKRGVAADPARDDVTMRLRAAILLAVAAGLVTYVVTL